MTFDWKNLIWHGTELISRAAIADVRASPFNRRAVKYEILLCRRRQAALLCKTAKLCSCRGERYQLKFSRTKVYYRIKLIMHTEKSVRESLPLVGGRCSLSRIAAQSTEGLLETKKSATKSQVRDNFSAILNLMFFAVFCMAENLSRTKFD